MNQGIIKNKLFRTILISFCIAVILSLLMPSGFLNTWESKISDAFYHPSNTLSDIIIVEIDDESIYKIGQWPFSRDYYATVIDNLNKSKVIGIDILFDLPREGDAALANALRNQSVVLAVEYQDLFSLNGVHYANSILKPNQDLGTQNIDYKTGFINLHTDDDKVTRSFSPSIESDEYHTLFSAAIVEEITGLEPELEDRRNLINFYSEPRGYQFISFFDVYNNSKGLPDFNEKIILIGFTASGVDDTFMVPIADTAMDGVEIHANLVQSILTRDYIHYQNDLSSILIIFLFALITGLILYRFKVQIASIIIISIFTLYFLISLLVLFDSFGIIMNLLFPLFSVTLTFISVVTLYYQTEEKSRKWITDLFGKYVSPVVINNLIKNPQKVNLGGEKRTITIFFSDIRKFTAISENLTPEELVRLLNEYLTKMTNIIIENQGLVDKYMGDAIMALWGTPLDNPEHAITACDSSLQMIDSLKKLQKKWSKNGIPSFDIGIGLNSGDAIVGNMGSENRFDYTAMGDNVNLASRMEGLNKIYGTNIIITENTQKMVKDSFETRKLDAVRVKGKKKPILIFELLSKKGNLSDEDKKIRKLYEQGLSYYFKKEWKKALISFEKVLPIRKDKATMLMMSRCKDFINNPPSKYWDGVWKMKTK